MKSGTARYDGHAGWYDETFSASLDEDEVSFLREGLGPGGGRVCLDVACGTGRYGQVLAGVGYRAKTLASFLGAFATSGLSIRAVREFSKSGHVVLPWNIAVVAEKGASE